MPGNRGVIMKMGFSTLKINGFRELLMRWHTDANERQMPWKGEKDPYKIWLSEIILQQTRVEQGLKYYLDFTASYPTVVDLANAADDAVFKKWEGLGYYSRCRNLLATARTIRDEYCGQFPADYEALLSLKGVGPYTAAAIASFAFALPRAVVDGNVVRVLSRYFGVDEAFDQTSGRRLFQEIAQKALDIQQSAAYNQAIMDFGATVCKPMSPLCKNCPLAESCFALKQDRIEQLPVKGKKILKKNRYFSFFILEHEAKFWVIRRSDKDIWNHLYTFFLHEDASAEDFGQLGMHKFAKEKGWNYKHVTKEILLDRQALTHQWVHSRITIIHLHEKPDSLPSAGQWVGSTQLKSLAFPRTLKQFLAVNDMD